MNSQGATADKNPTSITWLLVAYKNLGEVDNFISELDQLRNDSSIYRYAICDNSPSTGLSQHIERADVAFVARPDNPGYLDGALAALDATGKHCWPEADWTCLTNTDLTFVSGDPIRGLESHDPDIPAVIAPRITEGPERLEKNPHVITRRSWQRLLINRIISLTPPTMMLYQSAAVARSSRASGLSALRRDPVGWSARFPKATTFYSPYGAAIFFSRGFQPQNTLPSGVPLMAEEYFIAEAAAEAGAPVVYEPTIEVHHRAHTTTGPKVAWGRAKNTRRAFIMMDRHARSRASRLRQSNK